MLQKILIKNLAIISELEIDFNKGLTVLTGETGAGKSIILGSIQLLLGAKADINLLHDTNKKCIVEGVFEISNNTLAKTFITDNDLELNANELIIRREISANSRARAFINDSPCSMEQLKKLGALLIDLHRQFDTVELTQNNFQLQVLDTVAGNQTLLNNYGLLYSNWRLQTIELQKLIKQRDQSKKEYDYQLFQLQELQTLNLQPNELENLEQELAMLSNAEALKTALQDSLEMLLEAEYAAIPQLKSVLYKLQNYSNSFQKLIALTARIEATWIELKDIASDLTDLQDDVDIDEEKLNVYLDRLNDGNKLLSKHGLKSTEALLNLQTELANDVANTGNIDDKIIALEKSIAVLAKNLQSEANKLHISRKESIAAITKSMQILLPKVGMPAAQFSITIANKTYSADGADAVTFLFDANNTGVFNPLSKVASGGELSRLMLCIKSLMAQAADMPTLIFDEIDAGISGEVAKQVGTIMQDLALHHQLISVTHLPQIAAKANKHLFVYKTSKTENAAISTKIKELDNTERILQIAEMLSGNEPTPAAQKAAKELMRSN